METKYILIRKVIGKCGRTWKNKWKGEFQAFAWLSPIIGNPEQTNFDTGVGKVKRKRLRTAMKRKFETVATLKMPKARGNGFCWTQVSGWMHDQRYNFGTILWILCFAIPSEETLSVNDQIG